METLCWICKKAIGGCSWARELKPVKGWEAEETKIQEEGYTQRSYHVKSCPEFQPDKKQITTLAKIAEMIGVSERTLYRWEVQRIIEEAKAKGYTLKYSWAEKNWYEIRG